MRSERREKNTIWNCSNNQTSLDIPESTVWVRIWQSKVGSCKNLRFTAIITYIRRLTLTIGNNLSVIRKTAKSDRRKRENTNACYISCGKYPSAAFSCGWTWLLNTVTLQEVSPHPSLSVSGMPRSGSRNTHSQISVVSGVRKEAVSATAGFHYSWCLNLARFPLYLVPRRQKSKPMILAHHLQHLG